MSRLIDHIHNGKYWSPIGPVYTSIFSDPVIQAIYIGGASVADKEGEYTP